MQAGFIGLGQLGTAIATRLLSQGVSLTTWNRTQEKTTKLDAPSAATPKELIQSHNILFLCLFDSQAVAEVLQGADGLLSGNIENKIIIDLTTNHFQTVLGFHRLCQQAGAHYLESPVLGSVVPATNGALTVLTSGEESAHSTIQPYLEKIGQHLFFLPHPGTASKMKLINNLCLGNFMATLAEALSLGQDSGLESGTVLDILSAGAGNSMVLNAKRAKLESQDFSPHFNNRLIFKDLHCLQDLAYSQGRPLFTGSVTKELYGKMIQEGQGDLDFASILELFQGHSHP